jgi:single-strand DNA-binding protein
MNSVTLKGFLGADPEIKVFDNGNKLATLSLATSEEYTNKGGEKVKDVQWHRICAWGKVADLCENLKKGAHVSVEGKITYRQYTAVDGTKRHITEIAAASVRPTKD